MLKTWLLTRPYALFDASNPLHRQAYFDYIQTKSWVGCPYQFVLEEPYLELPSCINQKMVEYYMGQEFARKTKVKTKVHIK